MKLENIDSFNGLSRSGLEYGRYEKRILLYTTRANEMLYMQYPEIESNRNTERGFPLDARPILIKHDGMQAPDMDFKRIWDIIDRMGRNHYADTDLLGVLFLRIAYMIGYRHNDDLYTCEKIDIENDMIIDSTVTVKGSPILN